MTSGGGSDEGLLFRFLAGDHERLEKLLDAASAGKGAVAMEPYGEFRKGLLRHISMEEKVALPAISQRQGGKGLEEAGRIRLDHGALASLLVPPPNAGIVATIRSILRVHNRIEEQEGGFYEILDRLLGAEAESLLQKLRSLQEVPVIPHNSRPGVLDATRRAVERAGYTFKE